MKRSDWSRQRLETAVRSSPGISQIGSGGAPAPSVGRSSSPTHCPCAVLGIALGAVAGRSLAGLVGPLPDLGPGQLAATVAVLGVATLLALVGPIHRAGRIQPMAVLRDD